MGDPGGTNIRPLIAKTQESKEEDQKNMLAQSFQSIPMNIWRHRESLGTNLME